MVFSIYEAQDFLEFLDNEDLKHFVEECSSVDEEGFLEIDFTFET